MKKLVAELLRWLTSSFPIEDRKRTQQRKRRPQFQGLESRELMAGDAFVGMYADGSWEFDGPGGQEVSFGLSGDQPVSGDWNGDGNETVGVYRDGTWYLDVTGNGFDHQDQVLSFGLPGDQAVAGDWDGDGVDTVGVFRNGLWYFDHAGNGYDAADAQPISFGWGSDDAVAGDWNGDGKDTPGVYRDGIWALDVDGDGYDHQDPFLSFGLPGAQPFSGDWNGDGKDSPGVLQNNEWFFDMEGDGYTGEQGTANTLGVGKPVAGNGRYDPIQAYPIDLQLNWTPAYSPTGSPTQRAKVVLKVVTPRAVTGEIRVQLFWASSEILQAGRVELAGERIASTTRFRGNLGVRFSADQVSARPDFATHLIAVVNPDGAIRETDYSNNTAVLRLL
ncbi:MAG: VCBS repeat-containing protein [Planctomycetota bacterium]